MKRIALAGLLLLGYFAPQARAADTVYYYHTDALGSPVAVTDANRNVVERTQYAPYGQVLNRPEHDGPGYTGHEEDAQTGLTNMQQRYADKIIGRMDSVDPMGVDLTTGANFNRYAYASDNPYRYVDPDGRYSCSGGKSDCGKVDTFVSKLNDALKNMNPKSASFQKLTAISSYLGKEGDKNGVTISAGKLDNGVLGQANPGGKSFTIDVKQVSNLPAAFANANPGKSNGTIQNAMGAATVAHEAQHELDFQGMKGAYPSGRSQEHGTEENAYGIESAVGKSLGVRIGLESDKQIQDAVDQSTNSFCSKSSPQC